jgi:hypothetical protein
MVNETGKRSFGALAARGVAAFGLLAGCSTATESGAVLRVGSRNLRCPQSDLETALHRESAKVREYYVGCDFMYTRVLCDKGSGATAAQCHPAKPQPPCFGGGCFKEDPITFEWTLDESLASAEPGPTAESLFSTP